MILQAPVTAIIRPILSVYFTIGDVKGGPKFNICLNINKLKL
jgi:hypothetical protein